MSTHLYLRCVSHDPYIESDTVGHNESSLEAIQSIVADRDELIQAHKILKKYDVGLDFDVYTSATVRFLFRHPNCNLELWDEYGKQHPIREL